MAKDSNPASLREKFNALFKSATTTVPKLNAITGNNIMYEYANHELGVLISRNGTRRDDSRQMDPHDTQTILSALTPTHQELVSTVADAERLMALDGSLKQVENIFVSSIMSPNDLQDRDPTIAVTEESLSESQRANISDLLSAFYNDKYKIRNRMERWVKEAHFRSGAGVTMILPEASLASLLSTYDPDRQMTKNAGECFTVSSIQGGLESAQIAEVERYIYTEEMREKILEYNPYAPTQESAKYTTEGIQVKANASTRATDRVRIDKAFVQNIVSKLSTEAEDARHYINWDAYNKEISTAVESIAVNITTLLRKKKTVSTNPEILRYGKNYKDYLDEQLRKNVSSVLGYIDDPVVRDSTTYINTRGYVPIIDLTQHLTSYKEQKSYPFAIDLPTEAVIPVCVPGSKHEHLGYFVLIDRYGHPIEASTYLVGDNNCSISGRINKAYTAMYGDIPTASGIRGKNTTFSSMTNNMVINQRARSIQVVFSQVLDGLLRNTVHQSTGLSDVTFGSYSTIATCMLSRLLEKKETTLLFVPKRYITYMAFAYHSHNGTGKSKIDDILFVESLKVSMMVANVLATMKNAVPFRNATLTLNKEQTNPQNVMYALRNAIAEREHILPSISPTMTAQQIVSQNTSVKVTGPQTGEFDFSVNDTNRDLPTINTDFLDKLDNMTITSLGAPISAINEIADVQYAKSIATTNIFFAKTILRDQSTLTDFTAEHIKVHASMATALIYQIAAILKGSTGEDTSNDTTQLSSNVIRAANTEDITPEQLVKKNDTVIGILGKRIDTETYLKVLRILDTIEVSLPAPVVAPDQAHFDQMDQSIKLINDYVEAVFQEDLIPDSQREDLLPMLKAIKADIKSKAQRDLAATIGLGGTLEMIPNLDEYTIEGRAAYVSQLGVLKAMAAEVKNAMSQRTLITPEEDNDSSSGGGFSF